MSVKLGGYGSKREKCKALKVFMKVMPSIAENQFRWSKNSILMHFDTGVRGGRRTYKL